jgi:hypothetical protein
VKLDQASAGWGGHANGRCARGENQNFNCESLDGRTQRNFTATNFVVSGWHIIKTERDEPTFLVAMVVEPDFRSFAEKRAIRSNDSGVYTNTTYKYGRFTYIVQQNTYRNRENNKSVVKINTLMQLVIQPIKAIVYVDGKTVLKERFSSK